MSSFVFLHTLHILQMNFIPGESLVFSSFFESSGVFNFTGVMKLSVLFFDLNFFLGGSSASGGLSVISGVILFRSDSSWLINGGNVFILDPINYLAPDWSTSKLNEITKMSFFILFDRLKIRLVIKIIT